MSARSYTVTVLAVGAMFVIAVKVVYDSASRDSSGVQYVMSSNPNGGEYERQREAVMRLVIRQRNNISRQLNMKQQKVGQMECEKLGDQGEATSTTGGWCMKSSTENSGHHMTDKSLADALSDFFAGKYIASFGDGPGRYKQLLLASGKVKGYDAYDGAPFCETTSEGRVQFLDLTLSQYGLPMYDWIMSLEVAEHIPQAYESIYIDNIVRHAQQGVVLSWSKPGQGGYSHVNNRPFTYVKQLFDSLGFSHDEVESEKLRNISKLPWLRNNVNVYRRKTPYDPDTYNTII